MPVHEIVNKYDQRDEQYQIYKRPGDVRHEPQEPQYDENYDYCCKHVTPSATDLVVICLINPFAALFIIRELIGSTQIFVALLI